MYISVSRGMVDSRRMVLHGTLLQLLDVVGRPGATALASISLLGRRINKPFAVSPHKKLVPRHAWLNL